jgi:hypothetical protein
MAPPSRGRIRALEHGKPAVEAAHCLEARRPAARIMQ